MLDKDIWIKNPEEYEDKCIAIRSKTIYIFCYPIVSEVLGKDCKVVCRDGRTVKKVKQTYDGYSGIVDGVEYHWDTAGRYVNPYIDSPLDLFVPERYFRKKRREEVMMSNTEYTIRYGRPHPTVKIPE